MSLWSVLLLKAEQFLGLLQQCLDEIQLVDLGVCHRVLAVQFQELAAVLVATEGGVTREALHPAQVCL